MKRSILKLVVLLFATSSAYAAVAKAPPDYAPNQIIVKFSQTVANSVEQQQNSKIPAGQLKFSRGLDKLNSKYKVKAVKPLFKNFKQNQQRLKELHNKNKSLLVKKEKHILKRLQRAPKGVKVPDLSKIYKIELEKGQSLEEIVKAYNSNPDVEYAELNYFVSICKTPDDPLYPLQWPLNNVGQMYPESGGHNQPPGTPDADIDAPEAWEITTGSPEIIVAVIDTGVDYNHRDLDDNMWTNEAELNGDPNVDDDGNGYVDDIYGYDFSTVDGKPRDPDPRDDNGHGTHCAGIIAAEGDNGLDIAGVCWNAKIMALKFLGPGGFGGISDGAAAIYYAVENGAAVLSNSWGSAFPSQLAEEVVDYAHSQGVMVVAAAGNQSSTEPFYPAYYPNAFSVAATNSNDEKASFSTYGDWVDMAAPGVDILSLRAESTSRGMLYNAYTTVLSGTSMACPHVSGACAMLLAIEQNLSVEQLQNVLMQTTDAIDPQIAISGRLNLLNAVLRAQGPQGSVLFDRDVYSCSGLIQISLFDTDLSAAQTQQITLSTDGGDFETIVLSETENLGIFIGAIQADASGPNIEDGALQVFHENIITATYVDSNDGTGNSTVVTDSATADCQGPIISNVQVDIPGPGPTVTFQTEQITTARIYYSQFCSDPAYSVAIDTAFANSHAIKLTNVSPETEYFFVIEANDIVGNQTTDNNAENCYSFTTSGPGDVYVPSQYNTIQQAIDNSWDGGTVLVADGVYTSEGNRDIRFKGHAITVKSENGPQNCIIDCQGTEEDPHRGFNFFNDEGPNSVIDGFTITNGYASGSSFLAWSGGAILCDNSNPTIKNCIFTHNLAVWDGGGINNFFSNPTIINCIFRANTALGNDGGGINNESSSPTIKNCTFIANSAYDWGGAIRNVYFCNPVIKNCLFAGNIAGGDGGGMFYWYNCRPEIYNCTFADNSAPDGNALATDSQGQDNPSDLQLTNCILSDGGGEIFNNDNSEISITYSNVSGGFGGQGNINADPGFIGRGFWGSNDTPSYDSDDFWVDGDYHLLADSVCINAGDPNYVTGPNETDLDDNLRIVHGRIDMGAYEFYPPLEVEMTITPQTLNCKSAGKWVKAHITLPRGYSFDDVNLSKPAVAKPMMVESEDIKIIGSDKGSVIVEISFGREGFCDALRENGLVEIEVWGYLSIGQFFYGSDAIRIINNHNRFDGLAAFASQWLGMDCGRPDWCDGQDLDNNSVVNFVDFTMFE